jgi:hypothetical protein
MTEIKNPNVYSLKGLKIAYLNINRIINKVNDINILLQTYKFHILFIAETWLNNTVSDLFVQIDNYKIFRVDRLYNVGGGLLCYALADLNISVHSSLSNDNIEYLNILYSFHCSSHPIFISAIYRKPSSDIQFFIHLNQLIEVISSFNKPILLGDFNICSLKKIHPFKKLKSSLSKLGLKSLLSLPTHKSTCIDHIYTSLHYESNIYLTGTIDVDYSDHRIIFLTIKKNKQNVKIVDSHKSVFTKYNFKKFPFFLNHLKSNLNDIDFNLYDPNTQLDKFCETFVVSSAICAQVCNIKVNKTNIIWSNPDYRYLANERNKYYKKFKKTKDVDVLLCYKYFRNKANNLSKMIKANEISSQLKVSSPVKFWMNLKKVMPLKCNNKSNCIPSVNISVPTPNDFGLFFSNVARETLIQAKLDPFIFKSLEKEHHYFKSFSVELFKM